MNAYKSEFFVASKNGVVETVGKSYITHPEIQWNGKGIKWFDESKFLKKKK